MYNLSTSSFFWLSGTERLCGDNDEEKLIGVDYVVDCAAPRLQLDVHGLRPQQFHDTLHVQKQFMHDALLCIGCQQDVQAQRSDAGAQKAMGVQEMFQHTGA